MTSTTADHARPERRGRSPVGRGCGACVGSVGTCWSSLPRSAVLVDRRGRPRAGRRVRQRRAGIPARGRGRGRPARDGSGGRDRDRLVPRLRLPVHRAALHAHGQRSGRVAEPAPAPRRRGRRSAGWPVASATARSPPSRASARRAPCSASASPSRPNATWPPPCRPSPGWSRDEARALRVWIVVGDTVAADSGSGREPGPGQSGRLRDAPPPIRATSRPNGSASTPRSSARRGRSRARERLPGRRSPPTAGRWARSGLIRPRELGDPDDGEKRVLAAAADQIGGSLERERLRREATTAEVARRSDVLKSALLDSVSHDLRTPLASIRAAAGTLMDPDIEWPPDQRREIAASIDREAEWLNRLVTNLLDMSRVEAGELRPSLVVMTVGDVVDEAVHRTRSPLGDRPRRGRRASPICPRSSSTRCCIGQVLANALDNAAQVRGARSARPDLRARDRRRHRSGSRSRTAEPGVPAESAAAAVREVLPGAARRARDPGAGPGSASRSCAASSRRWAVASTRGGASSAGSPSTSTCRSRRRRGAARSPDGPTGRSRHDRRPRGRRRSCSSRTTRRRARRSRPSSAGTATTSSRPRTRRPRSAPGTADGPT